MGCTNSRDSAPKGPDLRIDFAAKPNDADELKLHGIVYDQVLQHTQDLLTMIQKYGGCEDVIRKALNEPGAAEAVAWEAVSAAVDKLYEFYSFSLVLEKTWPQVLEKVCQLDPVVGVRENLCVTAQIAHIFSFVFHFDETKMMNPATK